MAIDSDITSTSKLHKRLMNKAVHYLGRYQASRQRLRRVLKQFAKRKLTAPSDDMHEQHTDQKRKGYDEAEIGQAIEDVITLCVGYGYVDDKALAQSRARQSVISGQSSYQLSGKLRQMGIDQDTTTQALHYRLEEHQDAERAAAIRAMRKKRLGPYCPDYEMLDHMQKQKQFAKLARLGFSSDLIKSIMGIETTEEADDQFAAAEAKTSF